MNQCVNRTGQCGTCCRLLKGDVTISWHAKRQRTLTLNTKGPEERGGVFLIVISRNPQVTVCLEFFFFFLTTLTTTHTHHLEWSEWVEVCVGVPCATGPICSADGEGGGEGGKLAESSTAKGERERDRQHREDKTWMGGRKWKTNNSDDLISVLPLSLCVCVCVSCGCRVQIPCSSRIWLVASWGFLLKCPVQMDADRTYLRQNI